MRSEVERWLALAVLLCSSGCDCTGGNPSLIVFLNTDFVPVAEFTRARSVLLLATDTDVPLDERPHVALDDGDYARGSVRVAEFIGLNPGQYIVRTQLFDASGALVAEGAMFVPLSRARDVLVTVARICAGVPCGPDEVCAGDGVCCPTGEECGCANADECSASAVACIEAVCAERQCLYPPVIDGCAAGQYCDPATGCRVIVVPDAGSPPVDAGPPSVDAGWDGGRPVIDVDMDGHSPPADCDDGNNAVHPGAIELCNLRDDNCDTVVDDGVPWTLEAIAPVGSIPRAGNATFRYDACGSGVGTINLTFGATGLSSYVVARPANGLAAGMGRTFTVPGVCGPNAGGTVRVTGGGSLIPPVPVTYSDTSTNVCFWSFRSGATTGTCDIESGGCTRTTVTLSCTYGYVMEWVVSGGGNGVCVADSANGGRCRIGCGQFGAGGAGTTADTVDWSGGPVSGNFVVWSESRPPGPVGNCLDGVPFRLCGG